MPLDPATLIARTSAGDAELSAPRHGLAIAQRRLLTLLDQPLPLDALAARPGLQPDRLERDLARLAEVALIEVHRPSGATGPMFPTARRPAAARELPPPPTPTATGSGRPMLRLPPAPGAPTPVSRPVRRARPMFVASLTLVAAGAAAWYFAAPAPEPPPRPASAPAPTTSSPPPIRSEASTVSTAPAKVIEPVRVLLAPEPAPSRPPPLAFDTEPAPSAAPTPVVPAARAAAAPAADPLAPLAVAPPVMAPAAPILQETRIAPLTLTPVTREIPEFPREALQAGVSQGTVKARVTVDAGGRVSGVDIVDAQPRRVFDRTVVRSLSRWTFASGEAGRTTDVEIAFRRE
jgi:protein TonB